MWKNAIMQFYRRCARQGLGERTGFTGCLKNLGEPESQGKLSRQWISVNRLTIMKMFFVKLIILFISFHTPISYDITNTQQPFGQSSQFYSPHHLASRISSSSSCESPSERHILIVSPAIRGHATPLLRLTEELLDRGYNVSFATHTQGKDWIPQRAKFVSLGQFPLTQSDLRKQLQKASRDPSTFHGIRALFNDIYLPSSQTMYGLLMPVIEQLNPVVIVTDIAALGALDASAQSGVPLIVNNPTFPFSLESPPPWLPAWGTGLSISMSLTEKCMNLIFPRLLSVALTPPFITLNKHRWSVDLPTYRSQHEIFREARILVNTAFGFDHARRMSPLNDMIGVIMPKSVANTNVPVNPLPPLITNWLHGGGNTKNFQGVVIVCLGRMAQMEHWQAAEITKGLTDSRIRVLWIVPNEQRNILPKKLPPSFRVKAAKAMGENRLKVFSDPAVRAVISAGGLQSVQEVLYYGKPVMVIPFLADQVDVAARIVDQGVGIKLQKSDFDSDDIKKGIFEMFGTIQNKTGRRGRKVVNLDIGNSTYSQNARRVGSMLQLAGGLNRAADIVESSILS